MSQQTPAFLAPCASCKAAAASSSRPSPPITTVKSDRKDSPSSSARQPRRTASRRPISTQRSQRVQRHRTESPPPDTDLFECARHASKLTEARKTLRKQLGTEPPILSAVSLAADADESLFMDLNEWKRVFAARNEVTVKWLWLVAAVARKAYRTYLEAFPEASTALSLADITQEGVCGLMTAVERWDPNRDYAFDAYAFYSVKHAILRAIENQSRPIRLPVHVLNKLSKMRKIRQQLLLVEEEGEVSIEKVARLAGIDRRQAEMYVERSKSTGSIDAPLRSSNADGTEPTLREFLVDHSVDVSRQVERACTREAVADLVQSCNLEDFERSVLYLKYGLRDGIERVRAEVSRILDVRVEKVRRAELSALKKLRETAGDDMSVWAEMMS